MSIILPQKSIKCKSKEELHKTLSINREEVLSEYATTLIVVLNLKELFLPFLDIIRKSGFLVKVMNISYTLRVNNSLQETNFELSVSYLYQLYEFIKTINFKH